MQIFRCLAALPLCLAAAPAPPFAPGMWEETLVFALDTVNGSADIAAHMASVLAPSQKHRACYTDADLADPRGLFLAGAEQSCHFDRFTMQSGQIEVAGTCSQGPHQTMQVVGRGTYSVAGYDLVFSGTGQAGALALTFRGRDSGRRLGSCPTDEAK